MTGTLRWLYRGTAVRYAFLLAALVLAASAAGAFAADLESTQPEPVEFADTTSLGLAAEDRMTFRERGVAVPRVQVFYSGYRYVVGYHGIEQAVDSFQQPAHDQQFGTPIAVYVEDYGSVPVNVTDDGLLRPGGDPEWIDAGSAYFVVGSEARTPAGETAVPFGDRDAAEAFATEHGGEVLGWDTLRNYRFDVDRAGAVRDRIDDRRSAADDRVSEARALEERELSVVVGEDEPTVAGAVDAAPPGTTVLVPDGVYEGNVTLAKPLTLRGENATLRGDGEGSVVRVESDGVAVVGVDIAGVGNETRGEPPAGNRADGEKWDQRIENSYGRGDAGVVAAGVDRTYVADVTITTPANGVLLRDTSGAVVENVTVHGAADWRDGFMGVMSMRSPVVVQDSTFEDGRDGIYLHRSHGTVIRRNAFRDNRFGVHFMYTSDSLVADNAARGQDLAGITIMTDPVGNAVVDNDVRHANTGIIAGGSRSYVADNVLAHNGRGLTTGASRSLYERNVIYGNDLGIKTGTVRPSNRVVDNDVVGNAVPVEAGVGPLRVWTHDGSGNYWEGAYGRAEGAVLDRSYSPTDPVERRLHRVDGAATLLESPASRALDGMRASAPGLRSGNVLDTAPLADPVNGDVVAELEGPGRESGSETGTEAVRAPDERDGSGGEVDRRE